MKKLSKIALAAAVSLGAFAMMPANSAAVNANNNGNVESYSAVDYSPADGTASEMTLDHEITDHLTGTAAFTLGCGLEIKNSAIEMNATFDNDTNEVIFPIDEGIILTFDGIFNDTSATHQLSWAAATSSGCTNCEEGEDKLEELTDQVAVGAPELFIYASDTLPANAVPILDKGYKNAAAVSSTEIEAGSYTRDYTRTVDCDGVE